MVCINSSVMPFETILDSYYKFSAQSHRSLSNLLLVYDQAKCNLVISMVKFTNEVNCNIIE